MKNKFWFAFFLTIFIPSFVLIKSVEASVNADEISVSVYTEQGDEWFKALKENTNEDGVLELNKLIPAKYRLEVDSDDEKIPQTIDVEAQMYDEKGRKFKEKVDVLAYIFIDTASLPAVVKGNSKVLVGIFETDNDGVVKLPGILPGFNYSIEVDENSSVSKKVDRPRIKVKAKIDGSDWFETEYKRVDEANVLYVKDVISGKYKFKYKSGDVLNPMRKFNLLLKLRDDKGKKIKEPKKVTIYTYIGGVKVLVGKFKTTSDGKLYLPNTLPMEYKLEVD